MNLARVLKRPIITEKSTLLQERGKYVFEVQRRARKPDVARAVEAAFNVSVVSVNTCMVRGKLKRFGRGQSRRPDWKKAIVTLRSGDTIQFFEGA